MANTADGARRGMSPAARYIMIGGFLGAGKSTAVGRLARHLTDRGLSVGLITNDQGAGLVDTHSLRHQGYAVEEIAGGCFCCRFDSLASAAQRLDEASRPDVFLAEPVGSCTDLLATVSYPLRRIYGRRFTLAPLSVMIDPRRAARVLGIGEGRRFSDKVTYVYLKQLEEAEIIVLNKLDLLGGEDLRALRDALRRRFPGKAVAEVSARRGDGLAEWFARLVGKEGGLGSPLEIDYRRYGEGEALLGWLNATIEVSSSEDFDGNAWLDGLARRLQRRLVGAGAEVAHLKMTLSPARGDTHLPDLALVNLVGLDFVAELSERLQAPVRGGQLILNLRAEAPPEVLRRTLEGELASLAADPAVTTTLDHLEVFSPGQPVPTHRLTAAPVSEGQA